MYSCVPKKKSSADFCSTRLKTEICSRNQLCSENLCSRRVKKNYGLKGNCHKSIFFYFSEQQKQHITATHIFDHFVRSNLQLVFFGIFSPFLTKSFIYFESFNIGRTGFGSA
jgi:hypothetical protein